MERRSERKGYSSLLSSSSSENSLHFYTESIAPNEASTTSPAISYNPFESDLNNIETDVDASFTQPPILIPASVNKTHNMHASLGEFEDTPFNDSKTKQLCQDGNPFAVTVAPTHIHGQSPPSGRTHTRTHGKHRHGHLEMADKAPDIDRHTQLKTDFPKSDIELELTPTHRHTHAREHSHTRDYLYPQTDGNSSTSADEVLDLPPSHMHTDTHREDESLNRFSHRVGWLVALLIVQSTSSFILKRFHTFIEAHQVVVYYMTMLVGAGGNTGSQSTVLVVRDLARGQLDTSKALSVLWQQFVVGLGLASVLSVIAFIRVILFHQTWLESLSICVSLFVIVIISSIVGTLLPLGLKAIKVDPAHAGAAIQVVMDILGVALTCLVCFFVLEVIAKKSSGGVPLPVPSA